MVLAAPVRAADDLRRPGPARCRPAPGRSRRKSPRSRPRPRDCVDRQPARLGAGAARDVRERVRVRQPQARGGQTLVKRRQVGGRTQRNARSCSSVVRTVPSPYASRQSPPARAAARAGHVAQRKRDGRERRSPSCFCGRTFVRSQRSYAPPATGSTGRKPGPRSRVAGHARRIARGEGGSATFGGASSTGGWSGSNGSAIPPARRTAARASSNAARHVAETAGRGSGTSAGCAACACKSPRSWKTCRTASVTSRISPAGRKLVQQLARARQDRRAAATVTRKPRLPRGVPARAPAEVVDRGERVVLRAALERDLELARKRRRQRMAQEEARERLARTA